MSVSLKTWSLRDPQTLFCLGLATVLLSFVVAIPPVWNTFMIPWRSETIASVFLLGALIYAYLRRSDSKIENIISRQEFLGIILPMALFAAWSAVSAFWAASVASVLHHTTIWCGYLTFYLLVRSITSRPGGYRKVMTTVAFALSFLAILCIAAYSTYMIVGGANRLGIVYSKYSEQVNAIFPLLLVGSLRLRGKQFAASAVILTLLWLLVFGTHSRAGITLFLVAFSIIASLFFLLKRFRHFRLKVAVIGFLIVLSPIPFSLISHLAGGEESPTIGRLSMRDQLDDSNSFRKLMALLSIEMFRSSPVTGIGADNFGFAVNRYRSAYGAQHPDYEPLAQSEDAIPERAHNEYLQIAAELGIVGVATFAWFVFGIGWMAVRIIRRPKRISLYHIASILGIVAFLASSLVSSYSFRLVQNGFVFFFILAVAARLANGKRPGMFATNPLAGLRQIKGPAIALGALACLALLGLSGIRVASVEYATQANRTPDLAEASKLYETSMRLDSENPDARYYYGIRLLNNGDYTLAIPLLQESIKIGKASSADFSYLASAQELSGDAAAAEKTFEAAAKMYPRSPFVLTRHAVLLSKLGRSDESKRQFARALALNEKQANSWWLMIAESPKSATDRAIRDPNFAMLMDLTPQAAMYAVKAEREIRHPEERFVFGSQPF